MQPITKINGIFPAYAGWEPNFDPTSIPEAIAFVIDGSGWKLWKRNGVSQALIPVKAVDGLPVLSAGIDFTAVKLPLELVRQVTAWFVAVYRKHSSEAVGYLYYHGGTGGWDFIPPTQTVGPAHAKYEQAPKPQGDGWIVAGTIHSHGNMTAFHSGTDDADEAFFDGVHITIGKVDPKGVPEYACSVVVNGQRLSVDPSVLIDGMAPADTVPTAWLSAVKHNRPHFHIELRPAADAVYDRYYAGELAETAYLAEIAKLRKREEAIEAEEAEARRATAGFDGRNWGDENDDPLADTDFGGDGEVEFVSRALARTPGMEVRRGPNNKPQVRRNQKRKRK